MTTWYCYQKKYWDSTGENVERTKEVRLEIEDVATKEQQAQMRQMMKDGYVLKQRIALGNVSKCKG